LPTTGHNAPGRDPLIYIGRCHARFHHGREKLHYLNPLPIHEIAERWIGKYERGRLRALAELKSKLKEDSNAL
jgi:hypothetical protein